MTDDTTGLIATVCFVLFLAWFMFATFANRRKLIATSRWMSEFAEPFGGSVSIKWISSSAFHFTIQGMSEPFSQCVISVLLKPRDLIAMLLINRLIRRNDLLLIRCELTSQPIWGLEIYRPRTILSGLAKREIATEQWQESASADGRFRIAHGGGRAEQLARILLERLQGRRGQVWRLSVRRRFPQLLIAIDLPELDSQNAAELRLLLEALANYLKEYSTV